MKRQYASVKKAAAARRNGQLGGRPAASSPGSDLRSQMRQLTRDLRTVFVEVGNIRMRLLTIESEGRRVQEAMRDLEILMARDVAADGKS